MKINAPTLPAVLAERSAGEPLGLSGNLARLADVAGRELLDVNGAVVFSVRDSLGRSWVVQATAELFDPPFSIPAWVADLLWRQPDGSPPPVGDCNSWGAGLRPPIGDCESWGGTDAAARSRAPDGGAIDGGGFFTGLAGDTAHPLDEPTPAPPAPPAAATLGDLFRCVSDLWERHGNAAAVVDALHRQYARQDSNLQPSVPKYDGFSR